MIERLFDRPRILLPGPVGGICVNLGTFMTWEMRPRIPMQAPYWFGMTSGEELHLQDLVFGNESIFAEEGGAPSSFWDAKTPEKLIPIQARSVLPDMHVSVTIHNWSCCTMQVAFALWGSPVEPSHSRTPSILDDVSERLQSETKYWR